MKPTRPAGDSSKRRVLIVDDHPLYREGMAMYINRQADLEVCGETATADDAIELVKTLNPDLVTVDISLKESNGIDLVKSIKAMKPKVPVVVLSMHAESLYAERVLNAGASGYVNKEASPENILRAVRQALEGKVYLSESMTQAMLRKQMGGAEPVGNAVDALSDRELEVFSLIGWGKTTAQIAESLHLSVKTVETYRANIKVKLDLKNNTELIRHATHWVEHSANA